MTQRWSILCRLLMCTGCFAVLAGTFAAPAAAAERVVLGEQFTATWCGYCGPVRQAYSEMIEENPGRFAGIQIHGGDDYTIAWGTARGTFYGIGGYPATVQDGILKRAALYPPTTYKADLAARLEVDTDVTLRLSGTPVSDATYLITAVVGLEPTGLAKSVRLHMIQVLDHYPTSSTYYRNCPMQAVATEDIDLVPDESVVVEREFVFTDPSWTYREDIRIVAWVQEIATVWPAEVHQAAVLPWPVADCNGDGSDDYQQLVECDGSPWCGDCNENGLLDWCDIYSGASADANDNGIPDECEGPAACAGDMNCDGVVNYGDIDMFVAALSCVGGAPGCWPPAGVPADCPWLNGDCNGDNNVTYADIDAFVGRIGATCP